MPRHLLAAIGPLLVALLCVACSASSALTLEEYAEWCSRDLAEWGFESEDLVGATWGKVTDVFSQLEDDARSVEPPTEVERYHAGQIQLIQAVVAFAQTQDEDELFNVFSLFGIGLVASGIVEQAEASLSDEAREVLEEAGCLDSDEEGDQEESSNVDRDVPALIGERISVQRQYGNDRFDLVVHGRPTRSGNDFRLPVTVFAVTDEWTYETSIWTNDQIELVSEPGRMGRIYKVSETDSWSWGEEPIDTLSGVILIAGGQHRGALYFRGDAPDDVRWVELRYPAGDVTKVVDLAW